MVYLCDHVPVNGGCVADDSEFGDVGSKSDLLRWVESVGSGAISVSVCFLPRSFVSVR